MTTRSKICLAALGSLVLGLVVGRLTSSHVVPSNAQGYAATSSVGIEELHLGPTAEPAREEAGMCLGYLQALEKRGMESGVDLIEGRLWALVPRLQHLVDDSNSSQESRVAASRQLAWIASYFSEHPRPLQDREPTNLANIVAERMEKSFQEGDDDSPTIDWSGMDATVRETLKPLEHAVDAARQMAYRRDLKVVATLKEYGLTEQAGAGQPTTRSDSESEGREETQPSAEGRSR